MYFSNLTHHFNGRGSNALFSSPHEKSKLFNEILTRLMQIYDMIFLRSLDFFPYVSVILPSGSTFL